MNLRAGDFMCRTTNSFESAVIVTRNSSELAVAFSNASEIALAMESVRGITLAVTYGLSLMTRIVMRSCCVGLAPF
jgi:hypothetical protein